MLGGRSGLGFQRRVQSGGAAHGRLVPRGPVQDPVPPERVGHTVRRILAFFRPYRLQVVVVVVAILATSLLGLINPILLKLLIDDALPSRDFGRLNLYVGLMIVVPIVSGLIGVGQSYLNNLIGQRVMQDLRMALYAHLQRMPLRFFTETKTGEIQSRLANDVGGVQGVVTDTATSVAANLAIVIGTVIAMVVIDWRLTALSLGILPFFMFLTFRVGRIRREVATLTQESLAEMSAVTQETLSVSGILLTKTFGQQDAAVDRFGGLNKRLAALQIRQAMVGRWFFMIVGTIFSITPAFVYWLAGWLAINHEPSSPTIGDIVAFTTLQSRLFFPMGQLLNVQVEIQGALALFDRIFEYLEMEPAIADAPGAVDLDAQPVRGRIRFRDVTFSYPAAVREAATPVEAAARVEAAPPVEVLPFGLRDIDFEARPGELVALVGPSGSGKTTTTYLLPRLYDVDAGAVEIDGHDVRSLTLQSLGRAIGFVTQETYLFHASVRENLLYARPDASQAELEAAARAAAIHDRISELPQGYDTVVGERGYKLSGGEKQRVAIARVLLKDPRILILDEATSALDTVSERLIQAALERLEHGRTTIAIAHRLSTILRADQILVYQGGHIVERGTHGELLAANGLYARLYHEQFEAPPMSDAAPVAATA
ncbi:MAG TPA: ABC transporter ATP-binding protein [Candidatus Limnocylindrales bacterium]|nr:ABC transporter ATP-binding protein [Candidatus Limnocylindrales bacterium]